MQYQMVMDELESLGSEQTRRTYGRHGVKLPMFGVSYANLDKLKKRIKTNHELAVELWESGNYDARILSTKIADPHRLDEPTLDTWVAQVSNYSEADALAEVVVAGPHARQRAETWMASDDEWIGRAGWALLGQLALQSNDLPDEFFERYLEVIEAQIHTRANRVRQAMNLALIAIGIRNEALRSQAEAAAGRIGKVHVDHGDTYCKTPLAIPYIERAWQRRAMKAAR